MMRDDLYKNDCQNSSIDTLGEFDYPLLVLLHVYALVSHIIY